MFDRIRQIVAQVKLPPRDTTTIPQIEDLISFMSNQLQDRQAAIQRCQGDTLRHQAQADVVRAKYQQILAEHERNVAQIKSLKDALSATLEKNQQLQLSLFNAKNEQESKFGYFHANTSELQLKNSALMLKLKILEDQAVAEQEESNNVLAIEQQKVQRAQNQPQDAQRQKTEELQNQIKTQQSELKNFQQKKQELEQKCVELLGHMSVLREQQAQLEDDSVELQQQLESRRMKLTNHIKSPVSLDTQPVEKTETYLNVKPFEEFIRKKLLYQQNQLRNELATLDLERDRVKRLIQNRDQLILDIQKQVQDLTNEQHFAQQRLKTRQDELGQANLRQIVADQQQQIIALKNEAKLKQMEQTVLKMSATKQFQTKSIMSPAILKPMEDEKQKQEKLEQLRSLNKLNRDLQEQLTGVKFGLKRQREIRIQFGGK